jgi:hypothetical protein
VAELGALGENWTYHDAPMRAILSLLFVSLASAVFAGDTINTSDEALAAFRAIMRKSNEKWLRDMAPDVNKKDDRTTIAESTSLAIHDRVENTLLPIQYKTAVKVGSLTTLLPDRRVWIISHSFDVFNMFQAVLDAKDGKLIFLWFIPEG